MDVSPFLLLPCPILLFLVEVVPLPADLLCDTGGQPKTCDKAFQRYILAVAVLAVYQAQELLSLLFGELFTQGMVESSSEIRSGGVRP